MRITYMLWFLDGKSWRLISEGEDKADLTKGISKDIEFTHRNTDFIISVEKYEISGQPYPAIVYRKYCVTQMKGF